MLFWIQAIKIYWPVYAGKNRKSIEFIKEMILTKDQIKKAVAVYFAEKPVKKVWLFGSYARNEADENSDVDVLVDIEKGAKVGMRYFLWHEELGAMLNKKVDVVSHGWENKFLKSYIDKDKTLIYER